MTQGQQVAAAARPHRKVKHALGTIVLACALVPVAGGAGAQDAPPGRQRFAPVVERVVQGDLLLIGNTNVRTRPDERPARRVVSIDTDGDRTVLCATWLVVATACRDNSSTAELDLPEGARVVKARLYVDATLGRRAPALVARLAGPSPSRRDPGYVDLHGDADVRGVQKLWEAGGNTGEGPRRHAAWDVTGFVARRGAGTYTVADIVHDAADGQPSSAAWALAVLYELDPAAGDPATFSSEQQDRFTRRAVSWHDGFVVDRGRRIDVALSGLDVPAAGSPFAKSYHVVAGADGGAYDNLLFNGEPLGNSVAPGNGGAPPGVELGVRRACNSIGDVFNGSRCHLGARVGRASPAGGLDVDVTRIPDAYVVPGATEATLSVVAVTDAGLAPTMLAVSIDLGPEPEPEATTTTEPQP